MEYFIANWKMNMNSREIVDWVDVWSQKDPLPGKTIIVAPTYLHIPLLSDVQGVRVAAQDASEFTKGAHTGDVGAFQLKDFCTFSIVGHSEIDDPPEIVIKKAKMCLNYDVTPIICFTNGQGANDYLLAGAILCWEDPANISKEGTYNPKDTRIIKENMREMKTQLPSDTKILYGGSVNKQNIAALKEIDELDGVLVGHSSLNPDTFYEICKD